MNMRLIVFYLTLIVSSYSNAQNIIDQPMEPFFSGQGGYSSRNWNIIFGLNGYTVIESKVLSGSSTFTASGCDVGMNGACYIRFYFCGDVEGTYEATLTITGYQAYGDGSRTESATVIFHLTGVVGPAWINGAKCNPDPEPTPTPTITPTPTPTITPTPPPEPEYTLQILSENGAILNDASSSIIPSVISTAGCRIPASSTDKKMRIKCINRSTGAAVDGCILSADLELGDYAGGHDHGNVSDRPLGLFVQSQLPTFSSAITAGGTPLTYRASDISQHVILTISGTGPTGKSLSTAKTNIAIQALGSENWRSLSNEYVSVIINGADTSPSHPEGIYGTPTMYQAMDSLGNGFAKALSPLVNVPIINSQAASLPWGGLYDINRDWKKPHCGHRDGNTIDLSLKNLTNYEKKLLESIARKRGLDFFVVSESPTDPLANHWHATLTNESN